MSTPPAVTATMASDADTSPTPRSRFTDEYTDTISSKLPAESVPEYRCRMNGIEDQEPRRTLVVLEDLSVFLATASTLVAFMRHPSTRTP